MKILYGEDIITNKINEVTTKLTEYINKHINQKKGVYIELNHTDNNNRNGPLPPIPVIPVINAKDGLYQKIENNNNNNNNLVHQPPAVPNKPRPKLSLTN